MGSRRLLWSSAFLLASYVLVHAALLSRFPWFVDETFYASLAQAAAVPSARFDSLIDDKGLLVQWIAVALLTSTSRRSSHATDSRSRPAQ